MDNFRNHRKIVIVDGREAWVGGLNVGDEYKGLDPKVGFWRDTHLRMAGPAVQCVQVSFVEDWHWASGEDLEKVGIKVFRCTKGFMHHKVVLVDDEYCTVGTANFDNRSFRLNFEITMAFADRDFTSQVARMLENDLTSARAVRPGELNEHGFWFRFAVRASRLTAPVQ